jgi:hypothetical protein
MTLQTTDRPLSVRGLYQYHGVIGLLSAGQAGFSGPVANAFGPDNLLYVASRGNPNQWEAVRITKCTKYGEYIGQFGQWGEDEGQFIWDLLTFLIRLHRPVERVHNDEESAKLLLTSGMGSPVSRYEGSNASSDGRIAANS